MSKKTITAPLNKDPVELVAQARQKAGEKNASFNGDASQGRFTAMGVVGSYTIGDGEVNIEIIKKPLLIPWSLVEKTVRDFFA